MNIYLVIYLFLAGSALADPMIRNIKCINGYDSDHPIEMYSGVTELLLDQSTDGTYVAQLVKKQKTENSDEIQTVAKISNLACQMSETSPLFFSCKEQVRIVVVGGYLESTLSWEKLQNDKKSIETITVAYDFAHTRTAPIPFQTPKVAFKITDCTMTN